jgi:hypothetical protein
MFSGLGRDRGILDRLSFVKDLRKCKSEFGGDIIKPKYAPWLPNIKWSHQKRGSRSPSDVGLVGIVQRS